MLTEYPVHMYEIMAHQSLNYQDTLFDLESKVYSQAGFGHTAISSECLQKSCAQSRSGPNRISLHRSQPIRFGILTNRM